MDYADDIHERLLLARRALESMHSSDPRYELVNNDVRLLQQEYEIATQRQAKVYAEHESHESLASGVEAVLQLWHRFHADPTNKDLHNQVYLQNKRLLAEIHFRNGARDPSWEETYTQQTRSSSTHLPYNYETASQDDLYDVGHTQHLNEIRHRLATASGLLTHPLTQANPELLALVGGVHTMHDLQHKVAAVEPQEWAEVLEHEPNYFQERVLEIEGYWHQLICHPRDWMVQNALLISNDRLLTAIWRWGQHRQAKSEEARARLSARHRAWFPAPP
jgi:hypothetical protein